MGYLDEIPPREGPGSETYMKQSRQRRLSLRYGRGGSRIARYLFAWSSLQLQLQVIGCSGPDTRAPYHERHQQWILWQDRGRCTNKDIKSYKKHKGSGSSRKGLDVPRSPYWPYLSLVGSTSPARAIKTLLEQGHRSSTKIPSGVPRPTDK